MLKMNLVIPHTKHPVLQDGRDLLQHLLLVSINFGSDCFSQYVLLYKCTCCNVTMHYTVNCLTNIPHLNDIPVLDYLDPSYNYLLVIPSNTLNGTPTLGWCTLGMMELLFQGPHAFWAQQSFSKVKLQVNVLEFLYSFVLMVLLYLDGNASV
jgi:hypothetical protein